MSTRRIRREKKTIAAMVSMYCRGHHASRSRGEGGLCQECRELLAYAEGRIDRCVFRDAKPACNRCPVHCYAPQKREQVRSVMRFAGPRMMGAHPLLALLHVTDSLRHGEGRARRARSDSPR